ICPPDCGPYKIQQWKGNRRDGPAAGAINNACDRQDKTIEEIGNRLRTIIDRMTMNRREAVAAMALFSELIASARADAQTPPNPNQVFKHDLPAVNLDGWEVTVSHVPYAPGRVGTPHKHAGFVLAYVVEGAVVTKVSDQGPERVYKAGEMFYEQPGATH